MTKQDYIDLFNMMHPGFFEEERIKNIPDTAVCEEMILPLAEFDKSSYDKKLDGSVMFGYFTGDCGELKKDVLRVADDWENTLPLTREYTAHLSTARWQASVWSTAWESTR